MLICIYFFHMVRHSKFKTLFGKYFLRKSMHWHWQRFVVNRGGVPPLSGKYCHWGGCCRRRPQTSLPFSPPSSLSRGHASSLAEPGLRLSAVSWLAGAFAPLLVARRPRPPPASSRFPFELIVLLLNCFTMALLVYFIPILSYCFISLFCYGIILLI